METVVAVTHQGVIRCVLALATGWDMDGKPPVRLADDVVHLVEFCGGIVRGIEWNVAAGFRPRSAGGGCCARLVGHVSGQELLRQSSEDLKMPELLLRAPAVRWYSPASRLPARVRERIRTQEERSEILVGWIQLAFIVGMAVVYTIAPKKFTGDAPFAPVPWVLAAYFIFTLLRLGLAHARRLPRWFVYVSIVVDMALLLGLIFSFHIQYAQPPSFYLKSPTLMYVFVLIALRALNFEARYIVTAGLVAAFGWLLMVLYVVTIDPRDSMVTRDYITYLTSNSVLVGAEVDKIISILVFTIVLALASKRTARLLEFAAVESASNQELARFVPNEVVTQIKTAERDRHCGTGRDRRRRPCCFSTSRGSRRCPRICPRRSSCAR